MPSIRVTELPAAAGTLDDDDEFLSIEDGSLRRATRAQAGPKASIVQVADTANQFTGTNVETVLAEIQDNVDALVISGGGMAAASTAEVIAGTDNTKAVTPAGLDGMFQTLKKTSDVRSVINWENGSNGHYLMHLFTGEDAGPNAALIGLGIGDGTGGGPGFYNEGGRGLLVNNKKSGVGIMLLQNSTVDAADAYGFVGQQSSPTGPLMYLTQNATGAAVALRVSASATAGTDQILTDFTSATGGVSTFGFRMGAMYADTGAFEWYKNIIANGGTIIASEQDGARGLGSKGQVQIVGASAQGRVNLFRWSGAAGQFYGWTLRSTTTGVKLAGGGIATIAAAAFDQTVLEADYSGGSKKLGFYGATPVARAAAIASPTADAASLKTAVDAIRVALTNIGVTS